MSIDLFAKYKDEDFKPRVTAAQWKATQEAMIANYKKVEVEFIKTAMILKNINPSVNWESLISTAEEALSKRR